MYVIWDPRLVRISQSKWTSEISGTLVSCALSKRSVDAMSGNAAFFEPLTVISPPSSTCHVIVYVLIVKVAMIIRFFYNMQLLWKRDRRTILRLFWYNELFVEIINTEFQGGYFVFFRFKKHIWKFRKIFLQYEKFRVRGGLYFCV